MRLSPLLPLGLPFLAAACSASSEAAPRPCPIPAARSADQLIQPGEVHFAHLWQVTTGGENAEGYWSGDGKRLVFQRRNEAEGLPCDQIFVTSEGTASDGAAPWRRVSGGKGVTTCSYFLPGDREVLFASTQGHADGCPAKPDFSQGYVWMLHPEFDLYARDLATGAERALVSAWGYDAEATLSPRGDRLVFTSTRTGDPELWTAAPDGTGAVQITDAPGYDGGAFFSHDGKTLVFRSTTFTAGKETEELEVFRALMAENKIRPHRLEIMLAAADGSGRRQLTTLGGASFAPYFFPDDQRVIFASNYHEESQRNFDVFAIPVEGGEVERITWYDGFDSFPMFSPDGRWLAFSSNRGGTAAGETNLFVAEWR